MSMIENLVQNHPIRKTKAQKESFRAWFTEQAAAMGYTASVESKGSNNNIVVGDPETAKVTFTAHYDTPAVMPVPNFITPKNLLAYIVYQIGIVLVFLLMGGVAAAVINSLVQSDDAARLAFLVVYFAALYLLMFGPANKNNVNDNTSSVAAVMEMMNRLPEEERSKAAFILFDNEEKGMQGSSAYARVHKNVKKNKLIINLDCVGDGEYIFFFANKKTRALSVYPLLEQAMTAQEGRTLIMDRLERCIYPSDQSSFKQGVAVCACNKMKVLGYYINKIHTVRDTVCDQKNMDFLANGLIRFVSLLDN